MNKQESKYFNTASFFDEALLKLLENKEYEYISVKEICEKAGVIPKFSGCQTGVDWFKAMGEWQEKGHTPSAGDIVFFDWEVDGKVNHVGIVEKVENGKVYTVEGNSTDDTCRQKEYSINSKFIFGYGTPAY